MIPGRWTAGCSIIVAGGRAAPLRDPYSARRTASM
jgi:hypothetical protein